MAAGDYDSMFGNLPRPRRPGQQGGVNMPGAPFRPQPDWWRQQQDQRWGQYGGF